MIVRDAMTKDPITCPAGAPLRDAVTLMKKNHIGGLPVMDGDELVGILTESDIIDQLETGRISDDLWLPSPLEIIELPIREFVNWEKTKHALTHIGDTPVRNVMSHPVITATEKMDIEEAAAIMRTKKIVRLPVLRGKKLVGILTRADIVNAVGSSFAE